jgi:hypothetical protein
MIVNLNGWRRVGVVLVLIWMLLITFSTIVNYTHNGTNYLIYKSLPISIEVTGNRVKLPDGKVIILDVPETIKPWEIDWDNQTQVSMTYKFNYKNIFIFVILIPLLSWLLVEFLVKLVLWVISGFKSHG